MDPSHYSAHSLRAGFVSECDRRGIATTAIRLVTGHATDAMLSVYTRPRSLFESSAGAFFNA
jgi:integrase